MVEATQALEGLIGMNTSAWGESHAVRPPDLGLGHAIACKKAMVLWYQAAPLLGIATQMKLQELKQWEGVCMERGC